MKPQLEKGKNADFWIKKISNDQQHDDDINKQLQFLGWTVIRFWGKDIMKKTDECIQVIEENIFEQNIMITILRQRRFHMYKSIDLFAGIGGIRKGFDRAFGKEINTVS